MQPISRAPNAEPMPTPALAPTVMTGESGGVTEDVAMKGGLVAVVEASVSIDDSVVLGGRASEVLEGDDDDDDVTGIVGV